MRSRVQQEMGWSTGGASEEKSKWPHFECRQSQEVPKRWARGGGRVKQEVAKETQILTVSSADSGTRGCKRRWEAN